MIINHHRPLIFRHFQQAFPDDAIIQESQCLPVGKTAAHPPGYHFPAPFINHDIQIPEHPQDVGL
jgi:hypothetical protein